jgi:DMSO reductase family type II enzyme chaperone
MSSDPAHARSSLYGLFAELLSFPTEELVEAIREGMLGDSVADMARELPYTFGPEASLTDAGLTYLDLQSEYMRLFDLPGGGPACPLYVGVFAPSRREAMEELLRFYRHFGLTVAADAHDLPDALPTVLEFMHYLVSREAHAEQREAVDALRAAQRDVLERHVLRWTTMATARLPERQPLPFYLAAVRTLHRYCTSEASSLGEAVPAYG